MLQKPQSQRGSVGERGQDGGQEPHDLSFFRHAGIGGLSRGQGLNSPWLQMPGSQGRREKARASCSQRAGAAAGITGSPPATADSSSTRPGNFLLFHPMHAILSVASAKASFQSCVAGQEHLMLLCGKRSASGGRRWLLKQCKVAQKIKNHSFKSVC